MRFHRTGNKRVRHPEISDLDFVYEGVELTEPDRWTMFADTTAPGSATEERVKLLASLAATPAEAEARILRGE